MMADVAKLYDVTEATWPPVRGVGMQDRGHCGTVRAGANVSRPRRHEVLWLQ